jgi:hypothetical protein
MPQATSDLAATIQKLFNDRRQHAAAVAAIDKTLARVGAALGTTVPIAGPKPVAAPKRRRRRRKFTQSADDLVLEIVRAHKNPTTQEINKLWRKEGRGFTADNTLTKLVKEKKLKRQPLEGRRGSRYLLA